MFEVPFREGVGDTADLFAAETLRRFLDAEAAVFALDASVAREYDLRLKKL